MQTACLGASCTPIVTNYEYDNANRLISVNGVAQSWDNNGNLLNDGTSTYAYDSANRLTSVVSGQSSVVSFVYNGMGDRLSQTANGVTTNYTLDLNAGLTQVLADGTNTYLYGLNRIGEQSAAGREYYLPDALGSVRQLADVSATVTLAKGYKPYGEILASAGTGTSAYGFAGEWRDTNGLIYLRARYYSSAQGRFVQKDSWTGDYQRPLTLNKWNYSLSNPTLYTDPTGRTAVDFYELFGINLIAAEGTEWKSEDKLALQVAVWRVAVKFVSATNSSVWGNGGTEYLAGNFRAVYGIRSDRLMTFNWNPHTPNNNGCDQCRPARCITAGDWGQTDPACKPLGGYTSGSCSIEFASIWPNNNWPDKPGLQGLRKVNNVIHELGHAFNDRLSGAPVNAVHTAIANRQLPDLRPKGFYEAGTRTDMAYTWMQSPQDSDSEIFADQFLGWVYGRWANDDDGRLRRDFMDKHMPQWIQQAKTGEE